MEPETIITENIIIDEDIKCLMPTLDKETYALLEENIIENGCRDALTLWDGILIDGYNRYKICTEHGIPFSTKNKEFDSRARAIIWVIANQISRRNLTPIQLSYYRGLHYQNDRKLVTNADGKNQYSEEKEVESQNETQPKALSTASRLSDIYKVARATILRDSEISKAIDAIGENSPEAKQKILSGEATLTKKHLQELAKGEDENVTAIASEIAEGTYAKRKPATPADKQGGGASGPPDKNALPLKPAIDQSVKDFQSDLRKLTSSDDAAKLKTTLRTFINTLEALYKQF